MLTRRGFLNATLGAGAAVAAQPQRAAAQVDRRMIVDAQVHLWKAETQEPALLVRGGSLWPSLRKETQVRVSGAVMMNRRHGEVS